MSLIETWPRREASLREKGRPSANEASVYGHGGADTSNAPKEGIEPPID
jgi:hypothetical protein